MAERLLCRTSSLLRPDLPVVFGLLTRSQSSLCCGCSTFGGLLDCFVTVFRSRVVTLDQLLLICNSVLHINVDGLLAPGRRGQGETL